MRLTVVVFTFSLLLLLAPAPAERSVVHSAVVEAPIAELWTGLTSNEGVVKALGVAKAEVDLKIGGQMRTAYDASTDLSGDQVIVNTYTQIDPDKHILAFKPTPPAGAPEWLVKVASTAETKIELGEVGPNKTRVTITMGGIGDGKEYDEGYKHFEKWNGETLKGMQAAYFDEKERAVRKVAIPLAPSTDVKMIESIRTAFGPDFDVFTVAPRGEEVEVMGGVKLMPEQSTEFCPPIDVLMGPVAGTVKDQGYAQWIQRTSSRAGMALTLEKPDTAESLLKDLPPFVKQARSNPSLASREKMAPAKPANPAKAAPAAKPAKIGEPAEPAKPASPAEPAEPAEREKP